MSPLYAPLAAGAEDDDDPMSTTSLPEEVTVSTVGARAVGTGHHLLKVEGYSRLKRTRGGNGSHLQSGEFRDAGFVSLYLSLANPGSAAVHAEVEFELVDQWPGTPLARWCRHRKRSPAYPFQAGQSWGFPKFIGAAALEGGGGSRFLRGDCFAVRCKVTVVEERGAAAAEDMERMGVVCLCKDASCNKLHRARPPETFKQAFASFCLYICG
ncbi:uncharacterized protein LOC120694952 [Panicum virgatum]|uniref:uncharacterized protein LOC120694952 n=1 Tax=Panicum virgatum TaxID=38727 RepID=UPI0019D624F2|nr:uncharacterized protein LOC120694952 [Panicum virgatum]